MKYDDMLDLPYPPASGRPRMKRAERAAQFSPFAALTGFDNVVKETEKTVGDEVLSAECVTAYHAMRFGNVEVGKMEWGTDIESELLGLLKGRPEGYLLCEIQQNHAVPGTADFCRRGHIA